MHTPSSPGQCWCSFQRVVLCEPNKRNCLFQPSFADQATLFYRGWQGGASSYELACELRLFRTDRTCLRRPSATSAEVVSISLSCKGRRAGLHYFSRGIARAAAADGRVHPDSRSQVFARNTSTGRATETIGKRLENDGNHTETIRKLLRSPLGAPRK